MYCELHIYLKKRKFYRIQKCSDRCSRYHWESVMHLYTWKSLKFTCPVPLREKKTSVNALDLGHLIPICAIYGYILHSLDVGHLISISAIYGYILHSLDVGHIISICVIYGYILHSLDVEHLVSICAISGYILHSLDVGHLISICAIYG